MRRSTYEPAAFATLFDRHFALVHRFLSHRVGVELADDLAADTFVVAFRRRADYNLTREHAHPWLLGIAINLARKQQRADRRLKRALLRFPAASGGEDPYDEAAARLDAVDGGARLRGALFELPSKERELLLLFACVELSYAEIAETLGMPIGTVRSRIHRLRDKLRRQFPVSPEEVKA